jgi:hypothetical protein
MFEPHPNLSDEVNAAIAESELAGGAYVNKLAVGKKLLVQTKNTLYTVERREDGLYISGNAKYCPVPTKCRIPGSNFGGSMLKMDFVGRGMYMEFHTDEHPTVIVTSQVQEVTES